MVASMVYPLEVRSFFVCKAPWQLCPDGKQQKQDVCLPGVA